MQAQAMKRDTGTQDGLEAMVRAGDTDRYYAALFAPAARRPALTALYAFNHEVARTREAVNDVMAGRVRLQWWRDALDGIHHGNIQAHPVMAALLPLLDQRPDLRGILHRIVEAREYDLDEIPFESLSDLTNYMDDTAGALMEAASLVLLDEESDRGAWRLSAAAAARAWAATGLIRALPFKAAKRHLAIPAEILRERKADPDSVFAGRSSPALLAAIGDMTAFAQETVAAAKAGAGEVPVAARPAMAYAALAPLYLRVLDQPRYDPFLTDTTVPAYRRLWRLFRVVRSGRW